MEKIRYEIDPHNRLVAKVTGRKTRLPRFRKILDGRFKIGKDNELTYHVKSPLSGKVTLPSQIKLKGSWSLTETHDLKFTVNKWEKETFGNKMTLLGKIIDVKKNSILFSLTTQKKHKTQSVYILKLNGSWQADKDNRITFKVKKERGRHDILTFNGIWELNRNHQIIYRYERAHLIRKSRTIRTLTFKGHWDIRKRDRISYVIDIKSGSVFSFKTKYGIFSDNYIKYTVGIRLSARKTQNRRTITLFGEWKVKRNIGLIFEISSRDKKFKSITFGAKAILASKNKVLFKLKNNIGTSDLGVNLKLSRAILQKNGEAFLQILRAKNEKAILLGTGFRW